MAARRKHPKPATGYPGVPGLCNLPGGDSRMKDPVRDKGIFFSRKDEYRQADGAEP